MTLDQVEKAVGTHHLTVFGTVAKDLPDSHETLVLLGPAEPGFWPAFTASPEFKDGAPDPLGPERRWHLGA